MATDRGTIVGLHKKGESNLTIAKERRETIWKVVKKFREKARRPIDRARAEREQFDQANG